MFGVKHKHKFRPVGDGILAKGKVYVIEWCRECGIYQYVRVPSNRMRMEMEFGKDMQRPYAQ